MIEKLRINMIHQSINVKEDLIVFNPAKPREKYGKKI